MTTAFLFPGQGTDLAGAAAEWAARSVHVARLRDAAVAATGQSRAAMTNERALMRTETLQPVLTAVCVGVHLELADRGLVPDVVAGHSVGELAACVAAGAMGAERAVALAATRGSLMARESARYPGGMVAVRASQERVAQLLLTGRKHGALCVAAHNAREEWVLSGDAAALRAVAARTDAVPVPTQGAWHAPAMAGAGDAYLAALRDAIDGTLSVDLICNRTGTYVDDANKHALPELLAGQLTHPVMWAETMATLAERGTTRLIVCGPGKSLRRFAHAVLPDAHIHVIASPDDLPHLAPLAKR